MNRREAIAAGLFAVFMPWRMKAAPTLPAYPKRRVRITYNARTRSYWKVTYWEK